jgi:hypothetical protein
MHKRIIAALAAASLLAALGGCFSSDDNDTPEPSVAEQVPASASASSAGFIGYLKELLKASADGLEPVDVSAVTPVGADSEEPAALD